ncbi:MAG: Sec-independent protein translocase protein TatB [Desulfosarcinaceae bacterium]|jgi:TatA/E family protein of Tat protein translocase
MFGIGMPELILILVIALVVIGPKKLPDLAKSLGKAMGEFKKATNEIKDSMQLDSGINEVKTSFEDLEKELQKPVPSTPATASADPAVQEDSDKETTAEGDPEAADEIAEVSEVASDQVSVEGADPELSEAELEESAARATPPDSASDTEESPPEDDPRNAET